MAKYKSYDYAQTVLVAVSLEEQLVPGTLEHTIHYVVQERLDLSAFDQQACNDETGRPGYDPRVLLKVVLLGYARGQLSSRKLEAACRTNIIFMALTCGQRPDHSTIAEFVSGMGEERIAALFSQVLLVCEEEGLLGGTHFALDGYKLSSNAAKEWSGTHADLRQKQHKLQELVRARVREHRRNDRQPPAAREQEQTRIAETLTSQMKDKIDTPEGRATYGQRLGIVEPVFGHLAAHKGMNRSTLRGKVKVNIQWKLYCMVHNLEKIARYGGMNN